MKLTTNFLQSNWKSFFYPIVIVFIILFDRLLGFSFYVTVTKVLVFSIFHGLYVKRTKYIYDSRIYEHYAELRSEYEEGYIFESLLDAESKKLLFIIIYCLGLFLCIVGNTSFSGKGELGLLLSILSVIFILDVLYELLRTFTNRTDFSRIKTKIPPNIGLQSVRKRYMYTMVMQKLVQHGPACINVAKGVVASISVMEVGLPTIFTDGQLGPCTKLVANHIIYKDEGLLYPIKTHHDMVYEAQRQATEQGVFDGSRVFNDMPKRNFSFRSELERTEFLTKNTIIK